MNDLDNYAELLSVNCFLNAYCREFGNWEIRTASDNGASGNVLTIYLPHETIELGVTHHSLCGQHRFSIPIYGISKQGARATLSFDQMSASLIAYAAGCGLPRKCAGNAATSARFLQRVAESRHNISEFMAARKKPLAGLFQLPLSFIESEQALLAGHSVHPAPKVRQPMSTDDAIRYGPEGQAGFPLVWLLVHADRIQYCSADQVTLQQRINSILQSDAILSAYHGPCLTGFELLPMHPWQWQQLCQHEQLQQALQQKQIIELGQIGSAWHATSSMRSLYQQNCPYMLKFSLSVRLTNSIRHLQPAEVERGNLICNVLDSDAGAMFSKTFPDFSILREPAYTCLLSDSGLPLPASIMVFRDNPFTAPNHNGLALLAALTQAHPAARNSCLGNIIVLLAEEKGITLARAAQSWFRAFMEVVLTPLIEAQANYGMLMGAHQQNIVLRLDRYLPKHCYFRDCQGTGFSSLGVELYQLADLPRAGSAENHLQQQMGNRLFAYYLIINTTFSVISTIAADGLSQEASLLDMLCRFLDEQLRASPRDPSFLEYVLYSEQLFHKGNFICSLADLNENTLADPLSIYQPLTNPIFNRLAASHSEIKNVEHAKRARSRCK